MTTKTALIDAVAAKTGLKKKEAEAAVNETIAAIGEALASGEKVQLTGFGTFEIKDRAERTGRNPHTGEEIKIAASKHVSFTAGKGPQEER